MTLANDTTDTLAWSMVTVTKGAPPRARSLHVGVVVGEELYIFGGYDGLNRCNDFTKFNFSTNEWSPVLPADGVSPPPRDRHVAIVTTAQTILMFGGYDGSNRVNDLWEFDTVRRIWTELGPAGSPPTPRHSHAAVEFSNCMYIFGGYDGNYRQDLHEFSISRRNWVSIQPKGAIPRARYRCTAVVHERKMLLFGGHDGSRHLNDFSELSFDNMTWSTIESPTPSPLPRDSHSAVIAGDRMLIFGGSTGMARNDLYEFEVKTKTWTELQPSGQVESPAPCPRFCQTGFVHRNYFYIFGGYDGQNRLSDFRKLALLDSSQLELPETTLIEDLKSLVNKRKYSDITFIVDGEEIFGHKALCARCPYFQAMFEGSMLESSKKTIALPGVSRRAFLKVLEAVYSDDASLCAESESLQVAMEVFVAADQFGVERLKRICEQQIVHAINVDNAAEILQAADLHNAAGLRGRCLDFMLRHFDAVSKSTSFEALAKDNVELLLEIIKKR